MVERRDKNKPHVPTQKRIFGISTDSSSKKKMLTQEQWLVEWMIDLAPMYCNAADIVFYTCSDTFSTVKAYLKLPQHCTLIVCENETLCYRIRFYHSWRHTQNRF